MIAQLITYRQTSKITLLIERYSDVTLARNLARKIHAGQQRRSNKNPYFTHVLRVSKHAAQLGYKPEIQIAAALHDAIEDGANPKQIEKEINQKFGQKVLEIIKALTHNKQKSNYTQYLLSLAKKSSDAFKVKMIDMYDNLTDHPTSKQKKKYSTAISELLAKNIEVPQQILNVI